MIYPSNKIRPHPSRKGPSIALKLSTSSLTLPLAITFFFSTFPTFNKWLIFLQLSVVRTRGKVVLTQSAAEGES
ncbi:hypothetical protein L596_029540 [Steinernema carpocapsae]|uniref:Uncharacterized protein n=1 Tax=Steinernema carpocapsae TaxID=34508 RepID=A0A4U5LUX8_STECR|nr:hypothetical protein L596_029540 [Steinernema carpocapsae]